MTTTAPRKYIRSEPPALLTEPLTVTLQGTYLDALNELRQARHAMFAQAPGEPAWKTLSKAHDEAEARLGRLLESMVSLELGEPSDWAADE
ncbi:hypothetical protein KDX38_28310 [Pseudomonas sp. CDFA 602]|uniref:hypothetical protein n=1 Tax=Pseudomonas californiensis TaxID=2829823 RepID=UPI001E3F4E72|nr:hypothetical protein [Pseudomonas californiensis]MCD5997450.1 hypothetical protein [Pseudomonas californiensis]MCD6003058.1 hypothetical protein [Pseudomonas californiensis]